MINAVSTRRLHALKSHCSGLTRLGNWFKTARACCEASSRRGYCESIANVSFTRYDRGCKRTHMACQGCHGPLHLPRSQVGQDDDVPQALPPATRATGPTFARVSESKFASSNIPFKPQDRCGGVGREERQPRSLQQASTKSAPLFSYIRGKSARERACTYGVYAPHRDPITVETETFWRGGGDLLMCKIAASTGSLCGVRLRKNMQVESTFSHRVRHLPQRRFPRFPQDGHRAAPSRAKLHHDGLFKLGRSAAARV